MATESQDIQQQVIWGVTFDPKRAKYKARIHFAGQERYIGRYTTSIEAALAYDQAARLINAIATACPDSAAAASMRNRSRNLNFPDLYPNSPAVASRLQAIIAAAAPDAAEAAEDAIAACAEAAEAAAEARAAEGGPHAPTLEELAAARLAKAAAEPAQSSGSSAAAAVAAAGAAAAAAAAVAAPAVPAAPPGEGSTRTQSGMSAATAARSSSPALSAAAATAAAAEADSQSADTAAAAAVPGKKRKRGAAEKVPAPRAPSKAAAQSKKRGRPDVSSSQHKRPAKAAPAPAAAAAAAPPAAAEVKASEDAAAPGEQAPAHLNPFAQAAMAAAAAAAAGKSGAGASCSGACTPAAVELAAAEQPAAMQHPAGVADAAGADAAPGPAAAAAAAGPVALDSHCFIDSHDWDSLMALLDAGDPLSLDPFLALPSLPQSLAHHGAGLAQEGGTAGVVPGLLPGADSVELQGSSDSSRPSSATALAAFSAEHMTAPQQQQQQQQLVMAGTPGGGFAGCDSPMHAGSAHVQSQPVALCPASLSSSSMGAPPAAMSAFGAAPQQQMSGNMLYNNSGSGSGPTNVLGLSRHHSAPSGVSEQHLLLPPVPQQPLQQQLSLSAWGPGPAGGAFQQQQQQQRKQPSLQLPKLLPFTKCCEPVGPRVDPLAMLPPLAPAWVTTGLPPFGGFISRQVAEPQAGGAGGAGGVGGMWRAGSVESTAWPEGPLADAAAAPAPAGGSAGTGTCMPYPLTGIAASPATPADPRLASAAAAAAAPGVGLAGAGAGLLSCISTAAQALAVTGCCLHALTDLALHVLQQPRQVGAVGAMLDWLQAAWHREVVASQAVPLTAGPAAVAAAAAVAKAGQPLATEPGHLSLLVLDRLTLLLAQAVSEGCADLAAQRALLLEVLAQLQKGLSGVQDAVVSQGCQPGMCRDVLQAWAGHQVLACSGPAAASVIGRLVQHL